MTTIAELTTHLQQFLRREADDLAKRTGFIRRQREVTGASFAQTLILGGLMQPEARRKQTHHQAVEAGLRLSVQGLDQRFNAAGVTFMRALVERALTILVQSEQKQVMLPQFQGIYITDCTRLPWRGGPQKLGLRFELQRGQLEGCLLALPDNDQRAEVIERILPAGGLHLADLGFFKLERFKQWSGYGVYWLTRYKVGTRLYTSDGQALVLKDLLQGQHPVALKVLVGAGRPALAAFLLAAPLPPDAYAKRLARLTEQARLDQHPIPQCQRDLARWTLYLTNVPDLTFDQAHVLGRTRWQIELLFKHWKSHAHLLHSRSANPYRQLCEGYGKLIGVLLAHWTLLVSGWEYDCLSTLDALHILRLHLPALQRALAFFTPLLDFFHQLREALRFAPPPSKRRLHPRAFQLWYALEDSLP